MICNRCGSFCQDNSTFCPVCGMQWQMPQTLWKEPKKKIPSIFSVVCCVANFLVIVLLWIPMWCTLGYGVFSGVLGSMWRENFGKSIRLGAVCGLSILDFGLLLALLITNMIFFIIVISRFYEIKKHFVSQWVIIVLSVLTIAISYLAGSILITRMEDSITICLEETDRSNANVVVMELKGLMQELIDTKEIPIPDSAKKAMEQCIAQSTLDPRDTVSTFATVLRTFLRRVYMVPGLGILLISITEAVLILTWGRSCAKKQEENA